MCDRLNELIESKSVLTSLARSMNLAASFQRISCAVDRRRTISIQLAASGHGSFLKLATYLGRGPCVGE